MEMDERLPALLGVAGEVLGRPVSAGDDFLGVGGTSVHAVEIAMTVENRFGWQLDMMGLFTETSFLNVVRRCVTVP